MEDVLAVYTRPRDGDCPLVCLDETSKQLIAETRVPTPMKAGRPARFDYEYERNGTANLFMMFAPLEGWRHVKVTDRHTAVDYARVRPIPLTIARLRIWGSGVRISSGAPSTLLAAHTYFHDCFLPVGRPSLDSYPLATA